MALDDGWKEQAGQLLALLAEIPDSSTPELLRGDVAQLLKEFPTRAPHVSNKERERAQTLFNISTTAPKQFAAVVDTAIELAKGISWGRSVGRSTGTSRGYGPAIFHDFSDLPPTEGRTTSRSYSSNRSISDDGETVSTSESYGETHTATSHTVGVSRGETIEGKKKP